MERFFSPCTRCHDLLASQGRLAEVRGNHPGLFQELNLDVSTEAFLRTERAFTYADLHATLRSRYAVAWLTPHAAVVREDALAVIAWNHLDNQSCHNFYFRADGKDIIALARSSEHLLEICDIVVRLLAVSVVHSVSLSYGAPYVFINAPTLAYLMEQCQSLKILTLLRLEMDEDQFRVLGPYSRPDLEIVLERCKITSAGASALAEVLGRNQGPTKLVDCEIDNSVLADGLRGNSRLRVFRVLISFGDREVLAIASALSESKGLVELNLACQGFRASDETWGAICDSLETHPTLEVLDLRGSFLFAPTAAPAVLKIQAILDMMKINLSIHTIHLDAHLSEHELFRGSVIPYLETNWFRPRLLAIQRTRPIPYRAKVLGRALLSARTDANSFWMLLSGNAEVLFPSTATTIAAATNLPTTPATAAATSTTDVAAFAGPVTTAATAGLPTAAAAATSSTASDTFPSAPTIAAAVNAATPSSGQKRKAQISMLPDPEA